MSTQYVKESLITEEKKKEPKTIEHIVYDCALDAGFNGPTADKIANKAKNKKATDFKNRDEVYRFVNGISHGNGGFVKKCSAKIIKSIGLKESLVNESVEGNKILKQMKTLVSGITSIKDLFDETNVRGKVIAGPKLSLFKQYIQYFINSPMYVNYNDKENIINLSTMPGSSLRKSIKEAFKNIGLDKFVDLNKIEFINYGDDHDYEIPILKSGQKPSKKEYVPDNDYSEAFHKMDKFMPDNIDIQKEYYRILKSKKPIQTKIKDLTYFFEENYIDEDRMYSYFPEEGTVKGFAEYLIKKNSKVSESVNETKYGGGPITKKYAFKSPVDKEMEKYGRDTNPAWFTPLKKFTGIIKALTNPDQLMSSRLLAKYGIRTEDPRYEQKAYQLLVDMYNDAKNTADRNKRSAWLLQKYNSWLVRYGLEELMNNENTNTKMNANQREELEETIYHRLYVLIDGDDVEYEPDEELNDEIAERLRNEVGIDDEYPIEHILELYDENNNMKQLSDEQLLKIKQILIDTDSF